MGDFKYWSCPKCGGIGRKTHAFLGRCLTPEEVEDQKKRMASVDQVVQVMKTRAGV